MTERTNAKRMQEERYWPYACRNCPERAPTVGQLFDHIRSVHEKDPLAKNSRVPLILPPNHPPAAPPPPEVDVEDFIQYNTIIRPGEEGELFEPQPLPSAGVVDKAPIKQEQQDSIVIEESDQPTAPSEPTVYGCPLCKFESRNQGKVQRHIDRHYVVEEPPQTMRAESSLPVEEVTATATLIVEDEVLPEDGIYECGICHGQTTSIEEMMEHMVASHQIQ